MKFKESRFLILFLRKRHKYAIQSLQHKSYCKAKTHFLRILLQVMNVRKGIDQFQILKSFVNDGKFKLKVYPNLHIWFLNKRHDF